MRRLAMVVCLSLLSFAAPAGAIEDEQAQVRARLARENDPFRRARLQLRLAELLLDEGRKLYEEAEPEKGLAKLHEMLSLAVDTHDRLFATGNEPRKKPKGFKESEIKLRELSRRLEDLRLAIPTEERPEVEKIAARLLEIRDHILNGLMNVKGKK